MNSKGLLCLPLLMALLIVLFGGRAVANNTEYITTSGDTFVGATTGDVFMPWGADCFMDNFWDTTAGWAQVVADFTYLQSIGVNVVRVFPEFGLIMSSATTTNSTELGYLGQLIDLADSLNMRLDITGLAILTADGDPSWYDSLSQANRWAAQAIYWQGVSTEVNATAPYAVFCYDMRSEGKSPEGSGGGTEKSWYQNSSPNGAGYGDEYVTETIATTDALAKSEAASYASYISSNIQNSSGSYVGDKSHMLTLGIFDANLGYGNFDPSTIAPYVSFISPHIYQGSGASGLATGIGYVNDCDVTPAEPIVVEETFDLNCSPGDESQFLLGSNIYYGDASDGAAGYITHFNNNETISEVNLLGDSGTLNLQQGAADGEYEYMQYLLLMSDFGFEYPNEDTVATPTITPSLSASTTGGAITAGTYYVTCAYTWYSGLNETTADATVTSKTTTGSTSKITAASVTLPTGATGLDWYMGKSASGPFYYQGAATVTSGVAAAFAITSYDHTSAQPPATPSAFAWNPGGTPWSFSGSYSSGISLSNSVYASGLDSAPEGNQIGFIANTGHMSEQVYLQQGVNYTIQFYVAQAPSYATTETFYLEWGGNIIGSLYSAPAGPAYTQYTSSTFNIGSSASGKYAISFNGQSASGSACLIDDVLVQPQSPVLGFDIPNLNDYPYGAPTGFSTSTTGGSIPADSYYLKYTYTWNSGVSETGGSGLSAAVATTGSTSTITTPTETVPSGVTGVNWYASDNKNGTQYFQGSTTVSSGTAAALTLTTLSAGWPSSGSAPTGTSSTTGGNLAAGSYYITCTYTSELGMSQTTISPVSSAITTTGSTSSIATQSVTLGSGISGVNWYASTTSGGTQYYQGTATVTGGVAQPFTIASLATSGGTPFADTAYITDPTGSGLNWTFTAPSGNNASGISSNGTTISGNVAIPIPVIQTAFLEGEGTISQATAQEIYLQSSTNYTLTFAAAQMAGNSSDETFTVDIGGTAIGSAFDPSGTNYTDETTGVFTVPSTGYYSLSFVGTNSASVTALINNVNISPYPN